MGNCFKLQNNQDNNLYENEYSNTKEEEIDYIPSLNKKISYTLTSEVLSTDCYENESTY